MASTLKFTTMKMPSAKMNGRSSLPAVTDYYGQIPENGNSSLGYDEGLYVGYGTVSSMFPYCNQDLYSRELYDTDVRVVYLENDYLKATFYPDMGGKLAGLYDKAGKRELLVFNPVIRPCNLARLNAWTSGGIEYNCGPFGHHPFTCSTLHTAVSSLEDGTPVLRFYEFERIRKIVYQIDFFLPKDSKLLFARMRYVNPNPYVIPAYWWSNMAVPEVEGGRTIVPADFAYTPDDEGKCTLSTVPNYKGVDVTYPTKNPIAVDYFFKIPDRARKYEAEIAPDGNGMIQVSTSKLVGRKQFVWGQGPGGERWQKFLTSDDNTEKYTEIQAGLAHSQYEHLPMPPRTAWEWLEGYGAIHADPKKIQGEWLDARRETEARLDEIITDEAMEALLEATKPMATSPAEEVLIKGSGWGALENLRRAKAGQEMMCPHLDFGETDADQEFWKQILNEETIPTPDPLEVPLSWMNDPLWTKLLEKYVADHRDAAEIPFVKTELGMTYIATGKHGEAEDLFAEATAVTPSPWAYFGLAKCASLKGEKDSAAKYMQKALAMKPNDVSLARAAFDAMAACGMYAEILDLVNKMPESVRADGRTLVYIILSLIKTGEIDKAEHILLDGQGVIIPDIREGEVTLTDLWFEIQEKKAERNGTSFDRNTATPPANIDFRMNASKQ